MLTQEGTIEVVRMTQEGTIEIVNYQPGKKEKKPILKTNLYGLDFIIDQSGRCVLNEINGVNSGMNGFSQIYGDDRVKEQVYRMLSSKKTVTINDGKYRIEQWKKQMGNPLKAGLYGWALKFAQCVSPSLFPKYSRIISPHGDEGPAVHEHIITEKMHYEWMFDKVEHAKPVDPPFKSYMGEDSLVINSVNDILPHPTVNSFECEEIAENKFLQYLLLKDTVLHNMIPQTTLVGLGVAETDTLESMLRKSRVLVQKPVRGKCGLGFRTIGKRDVEKYIKQKGPVTDKRSLLDRLSSVFGFYSPLNVGDLIVGGDFCFESGMSVVQPFIDSRKGGENYSCVRAIVCNGDFIDAYLRYGDHPRVNLSQGASAAPFYRRGFDNMCENIVKIYEDKCSMLHIHDFKRDMYMKWLYDYEDRAKSSLTDIMFGTTNSLANVISVMSKLR